MKKKAKKCFILEVDCEDLTIAQVNRSKRKALAILAILERMAVKNSIKKYVHIGSKNEKD